MGRLTCLAGGSMEPIGSRNRGPKRRTIVVCHPEHGELEVKAATCKMDAVLVAAQKWDMQWSALAREASFRDAGGGNDG